MKRGIYITANDRVLDQSIALLNSIRARDEEVPVMLIPYDDNYREVADRLGEKYGVTVYPDLQLVNDLAQKIYDIFGENYFARPNQFRKQVCWFGEFDRFLYIDTDIVVFEKIIDNLNFLDDHDFLCCDFQYKKGIRDVFSPAVLEKGVFTESDLTGMFNGGFWASKKNLLSETELFDTFKECAEHREYFDFSQKTSDQPIINYTILKRVPNRFNITRAPGCEAGNWGGSGHFQRQEDFLIDPRVNQKLKYLHWAGIRIEPGCPYWDIWKHYRYLGDPNPPADPPPAKPKSVWQRLLDKVKG
ncbi:Npun_R2821/Npun_R2822 family protein [Pannus brasiliensis CCIBt3594]|uniref:Npun_R2821/Npun_R2822 family protein n=1 Tax=Pannus brasiliensis CCIBt3594 TaxID=1427578 RepID=A0AAW9QXE4_9CHRO